jgi:two-component sensor histidine kinase
VRIARRAVGAFDSLPPAVATDAELVVSELVTNALLHAGLGPDDVIELTLAHERGCLRIDVDDRGSFCGPPVPMVSGGLGLHVVEALTERWEAEGGRVTAWIPAG